jgi:hypothetical protein
MGHPRVLGGSSCDEVHDDGDDGKDQEQVNEQACALEDDETTDPGDEQNNCQNEKHWSLAFSQEKLVGGVAHPLPESRRAIPLQ